METKDFLFKIADTLALIAQMHAGNTSPLTVDQAIADLRADLNTTYPTPDTTL